MIPKLPPEQQGGRPRVFSEDAIFQATSRVLTRGGHGRLTLPAVAVEIGCARQTLVHRFGTKRELLLAYVAWSNSRIRLRFQSVRAAHTSPLEALRARLAIPIEERLEEISDAPGYAYHIGFIMEAQHDDAFRALIQQRMQTWEAEFARLIEEASAEGELAACDAAAVAHQLLIRALGASVLWAIDPLGSVTDALLQVFESTIGPWRPTSSSNPGPARDQA